MELDRYVEALRRQLMTAAEAGGDDARALAERLSAPLDAATRLVLLEALSEAADQITVELAPGSVDVRLRGTEPEFVVTTPDTTPDAGGATDDVTMAPPPSAPPVDGEEDGTARITLRLPESLKSKVEAAALRQGLSVNAWLVRAIGASVGLPPPPPPGRPVPPGPPRVGARVTGWAR